MKKMLIVSVVTLLFCLSWTCAALATEEVSTIYIDRGTLSLNDEEVDMFTLGGEGVSGSWIFGAYYSKSIGYDPRPGINEDLSDKMLLVYTGYDFIPHENFTLAGLVSYYRWTFKSEHELLPSSDIERKYSSWGTGIKLAYQPDFGYLHLIYLQGIDNEYEYNKKTEDDDFDFSILEVKGGFNLTESTGINAFYRVYSDGNDEYDSYGIGLEWRY